jgi:tetratricopeptide (TPR) repeat protein
MKDVSLVIRLRSLVIAAALVSQASAQTPAQINQAEVLYRQGVAAQEAGDPVTARQAYLEALKANPRHANAEYSLGQLKINYASIAAKGREAKFGDVVVPEFKLDQATLKEALDGLQMIVEKQSKEEVMANFIIQDPKGGLAGAKITLVLKNTPVRGVLQYVLAQANAKARYDEHAIVIMPR